MIETVKNRERGDFAPYMSELVDKLQTSIDTCHGDYTTSIAISNIFIHIYRLVIVVTGYGR